MSTDPITRQHFAIPQSSEAQSPADAVVAALVGFGAWIASGQVVDDTGQALRELRTSIEPHVASAKYWTAKEFDVFARLMLKQLQASGVLPRTSKWSSNVAPLDERARLQVMRAMQDQARRVDISVVEDRSIASDIRASSTGGSEPTPIRVVDALNIATYAKRRKVGVVLAYMNGANEGVSRSLRYLEGALQATGVPVEFSAALSPRLGPISQGKLLVFVSHGWQPPDATVAPALNRADELVCEITPEQLAQYWDYFGVRPREIWTIACWSGGHERSQGGFGPVLSSRIGVPTVVFEGSIGLTKHGALRATHPTC